MAVTCKKCGGPHPPWECHATDKQIAAYQRISMPQTEIIEVLEQKDDGSLVPHVAVQEKRRGRPKTITDMKAYKREKERQYRAKRRTSIPP